MSLFDPDPTLRWAFCMTHPDDEITICAWIRYLVRNGNEVFMSWAHSTPEREAEGRAVAEYLGVPQDHLCFHKAPDAKVCDHIGELIPLYRAWFAEHAIDRVCCGAFEQGHIDHDSTNYIVNHAFDGLVYEIPFYHTYLVRLQTLNRFSDPRGEEVRELDLDEQAVKRRVAHSYKSQNIWSICLWYEVGQWLMGRGMQLARSERMRIQTHKDFRVPNHPDLLARQVEKSELWKRWLTAIERVV